MSRVGEVALGIIGTILNVILLLVVTLAVVGASNADTVELKQMIEEEVFLADPAMTQEDVAMFNDALDVGLNIFGVVGWVLVIALLISVILSIIAVVKVSKNKSPKAAGVLFIFAGLLSGILLLAPILFYIAAIMCFVRKTPVQNEQDPYYNDDVKQTDQTFRPL
ncbi:MAG TPA: DUF4064 domain-containing protein [Paenisporosarcina sp.]|nr:DUF4064 domain-containing protein [Paenisporosarcina sp.]